MSHIEKYVLQKRRLRDDIPRRIFEEASLADSKKAAQRIIKNFLVNNKLPKGVANGRVAS